tara:strand:+ start:2773 stop:3372 length:600 start_codon:yes stop_codon:yes gene_type:complete
MALKTLDNFKAALIGGGARPNLFEVSVTFPDSLAVGDETQAIDAPTTSTGNESLLTFMVKAAQLPASNITPVEIPFRGRTLKVAGERTFDTWTITVLNDVDFKIRTAFEQWMNGISRISDATGEVDPNTYQKSATVKQLDRAGASMREYKFEGIFPTNVGQIDLSMDSTDTIEEYTVEFQVQYWEAIADTSDSTKPEIS